MPAIKIAIISDLHCMHSSNEVSGSKSTYLYSDDFGASEKRHPVKALLKLIEQNKIEAKLLLCPGDISNKADKQGLITGWSLLDKIKAKLAAKEVIATIGNHDIESRNEELGSVFTFLNIFDENYPLPNIASDKNFWSQGFSLITIDDVLILILNSCFYHSNVKNASKSKIEVSQLESIEREVQELNLSDYKYKIVLCHHHPICHSNLDYEDLDKIDKGDDFINLTRKYGFQIVIHGHKHDPRLTKFGSMPVFCAGSFSSLMNIIDSKADNTFHLITLEEDSPKGHIQSWVYSPQDGWKYRHDSPFPCVTGFGFDGNLNDLAEQINTCLSAKPVKICSYEVLLGEFNDLNFLNEEEQVQLSINLKDKFGLEFVPPLPNRPRLISELIQ